MQADRIQELREDILMEQKRTNAFREQLQAVNGRLTRVVREIRDRALQGVIGANVPVEGQGCSTHERESVGSVVDQDSAF